MSEDEKRVLIVEDELDLVETLRFRLEAMGLGVLVANDGKNGIEVAQRALPDIILLDVMLPEVNGFEVCRYLKFSRACAHIPIVIMSARSHESDMEMGMEAGADDYLVKPVPGETLQEIMKQYGLIQ